MLKLLLWLRYLRKRRIVLLSIAAVALSVSLLVVVSSLFTGFIDALEKSAVETIGDVVVAAPAKFAKYPLFIERLEETASVEAATALLSAPGLLHLGEGNVRAVEIWGIEPGRRSKVTAYKQSLLRQKNSADDPTFEVADLPESVGGFVGIAVVAEPNEQTDEYDFHAAEQMIGRQVVLTTGSVTEEGISDHSATPFKRRTLKFAIADIVFTGIYDLDKSVVYVPIEGLQKDLYPNEDSCLATKIHIKLSPGADTEVAVAIVRGIWGVFAENELNWPTYLIKGTDIATARQMQVRYVVALRKQMGVLLLIFGVVSLSVVVLIFCIFYMIVRLKQKDIAIIKSCGMASSSVAFVFIGFGAFVGLIGSGLGIVLGSVITTNINTIENWIRIIFGLKLWKSSVYLFSRIPSEVDWNSALWIVLFSIFAASIGTLIPAVVAANTEPVQILRYE